MARAAAVGTETLKDIDFAALSDRDKGDQTIVRERSWDPNAL